MLPFLRIPDVRDEDVAVVDCPTCPVSLSCLPGGSGTGWRFDCCGTAVLDIGNGMVMIDCRINQFVRNDHLTLNRDRCPLCTGGIMEAVMLSGNSPTTSPYYYLPTTHATFPILDRLASLRRRHQEALAWPGKTKEG